MILKWNRKVFNALKRLDLEGITIYYLSSDKMIHIQALGDDLFSEWLRINTCLSEFGY